MRQRTPTFHAAGTLFTDQHELKMWSNAGVSEGHFLRTEYGIWSMGLGHEAVFSLEMTSDSSSSVKALTSKPVDREGGSGIHDGQENVAVEVE